MNKQQHSKKTPPKKEIKRMLKPSYYILVMAYLIVPVLTPNFYTYDSNGPKFLAISLLNLISFSVLVMDRQFIKQAEVRSGFFKNFIGIAYTLFLMFSLLSFLKAINLNESVLNFVRIFTVFAATYILFVIFSSDRRYFLHLAVALTIVLLFDCCTVFYYMVQYIAGEVTSIMNIKSIYGHKNIFASAVFVKLPAALFLMFFSSGWQKRLGYFTGLCAVLSTLILSARAFYLGLALLLVTLIIYALIRYKVLKKKGIALTIARWTGLFIFAVLLYAAAQHFLFPKKTDTIWNTGIISRLSSINQEESSTHARLGAWKRSVRLIGENPLLGVGTGNWKIVVLKYENQGLSDYTYMYKNHNDFLEITAETGLPGGLAYLAIFLLILYSFFKASLNPLKDGEELKFLFLPAFGILAYSVDAFFNFPADRPEIQSLFAIYVAAGAVFSGSSLSVKTKTHSYFSYLKIFETVAAKRITTAVVLIFLCFACYILYLFSQSLHYQRLIEENINVNNGMYSANTIIEGFPAIPDISEDGESIAVNKARFLLKENRYDEAITLLRNDHSSPYDTRCEYFLAGAYQQKGIEDSAIFCLRKVYLQKPLYAKSTILLSFLLFKNNNQQEAMNIMDRFAFQTKTNSEAWLRAAYMHWQTGSQSKALIMLDSAVKYLPQDTALVNQRNILARMLNR